MIAIDIQFYHHFIWLDGFVEQFKNARVFQWLCLLHIKYKVPHIWNYFEIGHGKGEHYGVGACITSKGRDEVYSFSHSRCYDNS